MDFMSIDIEGADLAVIETIPFDKGKYYFEIILKNIKYSCILHFLVDISVIMIEVAHIVEIFSGNNDRLRRVLSENGYVFYRRMNIDDIYVKKDFLQQILEP